MEFQFFLFFACILNSIQCVAINGYGPPQYLSKPFIPVTAKDMHGVMISIKNMLVNFEHKFAFCPIQKSASSLWQQLFLRMDGDPHWYEPPWHKPVSSFRSLNVSTIERIMNDPTWTKAIFLRDPSRRLLSAYFYLFKGKSGSMGHSTRKRLVDATKNQSTTWEAFLDAVLSPTIKFQDVHWRPQVDFCGFHKFYPLFDFVGNVERSETEGPALLKRIGVWEKYGAREWALAKVIKSALPIGGRVNPARYKFARPKGYNESDCMFCANYAPHETKYDSLRVSDINTLATNITFPKRNSTSLTNYLTNETWHRIRYSDFYSRDYDLFWRLANVSFARYLYYSYPPP